MTDETHKKLTVTLGSLIRQTGGLQTYTEAIEALTSSSITLNPDLIAEVEKYVDQNKQQGYKTKEEFIKETIRFKLSTLKGRKEFIEIPQTKIQKIERCFKRGKHAIFQCIRVHKRPNRQNPQTIQRIP
jgi:hypothetical protein